MMFHIRLMTSNVWGDYFGNPVRGRDRILGSVYPHYAPDFLGFQEMTPAWWKSELCHLLASRYQEAAADTRGKTNYTPLFYDSQRFELLECIWDLYHEQLDASKGFTGGIFRSKADGYTLAVFCTHFWWKTGAEHDKIRAENAEQLIRAMKNVKKRYNCPVFFFGDLNCTCSSQAWRLLNSCGWETAFQRTADHSPEDSLHGDPVYDSKGIPHGTVAAGTVDNSIDHIGVPASVSVIKHRTVTDQDALDATDHSPVYADISF